LGIKHTKTIWQPELTALPITSSWIKGQGTREGEGRKGVGREGEGKKKRAEGRKRRWGTCVRPITPSPMQVCIYNQ